MQSHPLTRHTPFGQDRLICRHLLVDMPLKVLAAQADISLRSAAKWLAIFQDAGVAVLVIDAVFATPSD
jgi:hypothetical protein